MFNEDIVLATLAGQEAMNLNRHPFEFPECHSQSDMNLFAGW
jgi:hypothetical protein